MIDGDHDLPIARQVKALGVSRSTIYYTPRPGTRPTMASQGHFLPNGWGSERATSLFSTIDWV